MIVCEYCGYEIPSDHDDHYDEDHTKIRCPICLKWMDLDAR